MRSNFRRKAFKALKSNGGFVWLLTAHRRVWRVWRISEVVILPLP